MSSPFLTQFAETLVHQLVQHELLEISGSRVSVATFVAGRLADARQGSQLISTSTRAFIECPEVVELYADDEELMEIIQDLNQ